MSPKYALFLLVAVGSIAVTFEANRADGRSSISKAVSDDIRGSVSSDRGPEAGVWVIAQTTDLPTAFTKIVVTDENGRYLLPDLPQAAYKLWIRGYGLSDSKPITATAGRVVDLKATLAASPQIAAQIYPSSYWYSLIEIPDKSEFPGTGGAGNGIEPGMKSQVDWISSLKRGCETCHQMGDSITRTLPDYLRGSSSSIDAWNRRIQFGQFGGTTGISMYGMIGRFGRERALHMFADWTDRIAKGEVPPVPPRPQGIERRVVITEWDWSDGKEFVHDSISTDRRNPSVNANGPIFGTAHSNGGILYLNPQLNSAGIIKLEPLEGQESHMTSFSPLTMTSASPYWGDELVWTSPMRVHNPMLDDRGRLWFTAASRGPANPEYCKQSSGNPSASRFPLATSGRQLAMYDPKTEHVTFIDTCFTAQQLEFSDDSSGMLWLVGDSGAVGWFDTKKFETTHDPNTAQGWCPYILDVNGNGKVDDYVEPDQPTDPTKDKRIGGFAYGLMPHPTDGSVWIAVSSVPGYILRVDPKTCLAEMYEPPSADGTSASSGFSPSGIDIDSKGVVWTTLASGHLASFNRTKCKTRSGPTATGQQCRQAWTLYPTPGPKFKGASDQYNTDIHYWVWIDRYNVFGLGRDVPITTGGGSDSLLALSPSDKKFVILRVPYPMGFYQRGLDGRIDDPKNGWKGRGLWASYNEMVPWHIEGGKGTRGKVLHFQLRPSPLSE